MSAAYRFGDRWFEAEGPYLTLRLRESNDVLGDPGSLRARLAEDGYLFVRELHDPADVLAARRDILGLMAEDGLLDPAAPLADGVANPAAGDPATTSTRARTRYKTPSLRAVVYGPRLAGFFERLLGGPVASYGFQWLRAAGPGAASPIHGDAPYMSRGTAGVASCWTPIGEVPPELGALVVCLGSHRWERVRETYGRSDVDRDLTEGIFSRDPAELVDRFGGRWATAHFQAGDVVVFGLHLLHASLTNTTRRYRLSCDVRYQLAAEPMDERWAGPAPPGHAGFWAPGARLEPVEASRARWGL
jgi:hypothetical protein